MMSNNKSIVEIQKGAIKLIKYNRPHKKNAIDYNMYLRVTQVLNDAAKDDSVSVTVITGTDDYYSSGNDVTATFESDIETVLKKFIQAFITFPKLLVAIVNGPAIGIAATTLPLCDLVFASDNSYFYTPFTKLGIVAEGCSTFTFPRLMGERKAAQMLLYNYKMSAKEALEWGFVNYVYKPGELQSKVWDKIIEVSELPQHSLSSTKKLLRSSIQDQLLRTNEKEMEELNKIWSSGEYLNFIMNFLNRKSKI